MKWEAFRSHCRDGLDGINLFPTAAHIPEAARKHSIFVNSPFHLNGLLTSETCWLPFKACTLWETTPSAHENNQYKTQWHLERKPTTSLLRSKAQQYSVGVIVRERCLGLHP